MAITVTIDGQNRTSNIVKGSFRKRDRINNRTDVCYFDVKKYGTKTYVPSLNDEVVVTKDGTKVFGGYIVRVAIRTEAARNVVIYEVECKDYSHRLARRLVTERYEDKTISYIINDLLTTYASGDGFTKVNASSTFSIDSIAFNRLTIPQCLDKLAKLLNYFWYVDYDKDIHFFSKYTEAAPENITDSSNTVIDDSLHITEDITQLRNAVLVEGGEKVSDTSRTEVFIGDATNSKDTFDLGYKFSTKPTVTVGGIGQTVGIEFIDDDASFDCMWNFNEKYVRFTSGNIPPDASVIEVTGTPLIPIVVNVPSAVSIGEYGRFEHTIKDKTIKTQDEAIDRAINELDAYANEINEGAFRTYVDGFRSGQVLNINSTALSKNIDVLIQDVDVRVHDATGDKFIYSVTFATLKTLGIIEFLQQRVLSEDITEDELETLLNYFQFSDSLSLSDNINTPTTTSPPYKWSNDAETTPNAGKWNMSTWS